MTLSQDLLPISKIKVGDSVWLAEGEDCPVGGSVKVIDSRGNVLVTEIVPPDESASN